MTNPNCDGSRCRAAEGEVRVLPTSRHSNAIFCRDCFDHEIRWRNDRNRDLIPSARFDLPAWDALEVYAVAGEREPIFRAPAPVIRVSRVTAARWLAEIEELPAEGQGGLVAKIRSELTRLLK